MKNILKSRLFNPLKNLRQSRRFQEFVQQYLGVILIPVSFYSNAASIADIRHSFEYRSGEPPYLDPEVFDAPRLRAVLDSLIEHATGFDPDTDGDEAECANGFFWNNSQFTHSDAMAYFAMLRMIKPARVVEIGSGFSTLVAARALELNAKGQITCIEPYPRAFLSRTGNVTLLPVQAQEVHVDQLNDLLADGDVLFIDSTHTVKTGSDCLHIYLRLLPKLTKSIYIHVHDIFLPFGMPQEWLLERQILWTEQYLLLAWLLQNPRATVLYGSAYHEHFNPGPLAAMMHGRYSPGGSSFWIKYNPG